MKTNKLAQKIIVNLYLRYRRNRRYLKRHIEYYNDNPEAYSKNEHAEFSRRHGLVSVENDCWNALQASKQIYYNNL